ncbi:MAG: methyltransferase [Candidatus Marinimicrobia bacterium]|nr:methyltransferase [Candidatus Neomarinimicrobiota bacterium]|tara:strand:+ start:212 stop:1444 length:1233 start_codon:yes stop_codon:yes gene_type:complete
MKKLSKIIDRCQFSKKKDLKSVLSLGYLPAVNEVVKIDKRNFSSNFFPTDLTYSKSSKLFQINNIVNKEILFPKSYPYTSSTTKILRDNFKNLYEETNKFFKLKKEDLVVDIGSNDGNLLKRFKNVRVLGVTPENVGKKAIKDGIPTILDYFNNKTSKKIAQKYGKAKIVTATNVFAHIDNISELMKNISKILKKDGIFITESHYFLTLIKTLQYDTIYHEHLRYYTLTSLKIILKKFGFKIIHAKKIPTHGGSIRVYATKDKRIKSKKSIKKILFEEKKNITPKKIKIFSDRVLQSKFSLLKIIYKLKKNNKKIFGIGAPSRASTLASYVGLNKDFIECIGEIEGSKKIGNYLPGTDIPIVSEKNLFKMKPDYLLLFSWHIAKELKNNLKKKGFKGKFILPLPVPRVEN